MSTPWVGFLKTALKKNTAPPSRFCQLATVGADGGPRVRTVVFRGLRDEMQAHAASTRSPTFPATPSTTHDHASPQQAQQQQRVPPDLLFVSNTHAHKVGEILADARGEVAWYFGHTREQFRLRGKLRVVTEPEEAKEEQPRDDSARALQALRQTVWRSLSDQTRRQMFWPQPGEPRNPDTPASHWTEGVPSMHVDVSSDSAPPRTFALVLLHVEHVDHLCLRSNRRTAFARGTATDGDTVAWTTTDVNP